MPVQKKIALKKPKSSNKKKNKFTVYKNGEIIFNEGELGGSVYLIQSGKVRVFRQRGDLSVDLAVCNTGEILGTMSLIGNTKRMASAMAVGKVECKVVTASAISEMDGQVPKWYQALYKDILFRLKDIDHRYVEAQIKLDQISENYVSMELGAARFIALLPLLFEQYKENSNEGELLMIEKATMNADPIIGIDACWLKALIEGFSKTGLIELVDGGHKGKGLRLNNQKLCNEFAFFVRKYVNTKVAKRPKILSSIEKKFLQGLIFLAKKKLQEGEKEVTLPLDFIAKKIEPSFGVKYDAKMYEYFEKQKYFQTTKEDGFDQVVLSPTAINKELIFNASLASLYKVKSDWLAAQEEDK